MIKMFRLCGVCVCMALMGQGMAFAQETGEKSGGARIEVETVSQGRGQGRGMTAEVYVNGRARGTAVGGRLATLSLKPGSYIIEAVGIDGPYRASYGRLRITAYEGGIQTAVVKLTSRTFNLPYDASPAAMKVLRPTQQAAQDQLEADGLVPDMVPMPRGSFMMGRREGDWRKYPGLFTKLLKAFGSGQQPLHRVTFDYDFEMGRTELTQRLWRAVMDYNPSRWADETYPIEYASFLEIEVFLKRLNALYGLTGRVDRYRLPSEAEWEYVARAGTETFFYWGDEIGVGNANCDGCGSQWDYSQIAPVGSFAPNPWGLYDMVGNVGEYAADCHNRTYEGAPADGSAWMTGNCTKVINRGGKYYSKPRILNHAARLRYSKKTKFAGNGFRLARTVVNDTVRLKAMSEIAN